MKKSLFKIHKVIKSSSETKKYFLGIRYYKKIKNKAESLEKKKILFIKIIKRKYSKKIYFFGIKIYSFFNLKKCLLDIYQKENYIINLLNNRSYSNIPSNFSVSELEEYTEEPFLRLDGYKILQQRQNIKFGDKI